MSRNYSIIVVFGITALLGLVGVSVFGQNTLPLAKQIIEQRYLAERLIGTTNPAPRNPDAGYPVVQEPGFETGILEDCDSFHALTVSNCWHGVVNGAQTQVFAGAETADIDTQQGAVILMRGVPNLIPTPLHAGGVRIVAAQQSLLTLISADGPYVLTFDASTGKFTSVVLDKTPPTISGLPVPGHVLWPPDQKMVAVAVITATDAESSVASFDVTATSSEPQDQKDPDVVVSGNGVGPRTVQLRAGRLGTGNGRVYTLTATASDIAGNRQTTVTTCVVPHDQSE